MTEPFDYKCQFDRVMLLVRAAAELPIDIDALNEHHARAEAVGPLLAPSEFMRGGADNLRDQAEVLRLATPFVRGCRTLVESLKESRA